MSREIGLQVSNTGANIGSKRRARAVAAEIDRLRAALLNGVQARLLDPVGVTVELHVTQHHDRREEQSRRIRLVLQRRRGLGGKRSTQRT